MKIGLLVKRVMRDPIGQPDEVAWFWVAVDWIIVGVVSFSAVDHLFAFDRFYLFVMRYELFPAKMSLLIANALPVVMLSAAVAIAGRRDRMIGHAFSVVVFSSFAIAVALANYRGLDISCGCAVNDSGISWSTLLKPLAFCSLSLAALGDLMNRGNITNRVTADGSRTKVGNYRLGFTVLELLVVIAIIGILAGILLPAVANVRGASRRIQCINNLKQLSLAAQLHENSHGHLPSGGWGSHWVGIRDRGNGTRQPGGWAYSILPFVEGGNVQNLAPTSAEVGTSISSEFYANNHINLTCPSKLAWGEDVTYSNKIWNAELGTSSPSDYAMNAGTQPRGSEYPGPVSLSLGDSSSFAWPSMDQFDGVCGVRSKTRIRDIMDGTSNVFLFGEKFVRRSTGTLGGDDRSPWVGFSLSSVRYVFFPIFVDGDPHGDAQSFGTSHGTVVPMSFCDGSVHNLSITTDLEVLKSQARRADGGIID